MSGNINFCLELFQSRFLRLLYDERGDVPEILLGFGLVSLIGSLLGTLFMPLDDNLNGAYRYISGAIGYTYAVAWSISFYPQVLSNYYRRSTDGLSIDFVLLNLFGFLCYAVFNATFYWSTAVQMAYQEQSGEEDVLVQSNDVAFAFHAVLICSVTLGQIMYYDSFSTDANDDSGTRYIGGGEQSSLLSRPSRLVRNFLASLIMGCFIYAVLILSTGGGVGEAHCRIDGWICNMLNWLDYLYMLSFVKLLITITKYIPQVLLNYKRQSTEGWSIWAILLDFMGGILSTLQLVLDCYNLNDWSGISGDPAKFGLGLISILFDVSKI